MLRRLQAFMRLLLREHTAPGRVAAAIFVGSVVGCTPLFGLHLWVCLLLSLVLRLNKVIVYGAANISIPPLVPLLGAASVEIGEYLLHGRFLWLTRAEFHREGLRVLVLRFFASWMVGGVVLGAAIGLVSAGIVYGLLRVRRPAQETPQPLAAALSRARERYRPLPPRYRYYALSKYRMDPCYRAICALVPPGALVVDLGTGLGMLPVAVGELGEGRRALGIEWDAAKVACGQAAAAGLAGVEIVAGDIRERDLPPCGVVTLVDVLHYYDEAGQRQLLSRAAAALGAGGLLLIREGDRQRRGGARWTRLVERGMVRLGWNRGPRVHFRPVQALIDDLGALGFDVRQQEVAGPLFPGNVLLGAVLRSR